MYPSRLRRQLDYAQIVTVAVITWLIHRVLDRVITRQNARRLFSFLRLHHRDILASMRPINSVFAAVAVLVGAYVTTGNISAGVVSAMIAAFLISSGGFAVNDYYDRDLDAVNGHHTPCALGLISPAKARTLGFVLLVSGVSVAVATLNVLVALIAITNSLLLCLYSWVFRVRHAIVGNLAKSYLPAIAYVFGWAASLDNAHPQFPLVLGFMFGITLLAGMGREILKAIGDLRADSQWGVRSAPMRFGVRGATWLATVFVATVAAISPLPFLLGAFGVFYLVVFIFVDTIALMSCVRLLIKFQDGPAQEAMMKHARYSTTLLLCAMSIGVIGFAVG